MPLIGLFSGLRLSEIIQLHFGDIKLDGPIPYFNICEDGGGNLGSGDAKHVKSKAGIRRVPIHPALMQLGFDRFVQQRAKQMKAKGLAIDAVIARISMSVSPDHLVVGLRSARGA